MRKRKILNYIIGGCIIGIAIFLIGLLGRFQLGQPTEMESLILNDYPELFGKGVIIVVGENAIQMESEVGRAIAEKLRELTGNKPLIKEDTEVTEKDKTKFNLIVVGIPTTNSILREVYEITDVIKITNEYPGENKGILEILRNPWNSEKALLMVAGSDEWGMKAAGELLEQIQNIGKNSVIVAWKESKGIFARTIPTDKYIFIEIEKRIKIEPTPPHLMIQRYPLTYYFDESSGNLKVWPIGSAKKDKLMINDDLAVLIGNTITIEKVSGSGRGIMPPIYAIPFSFQKKDLGFLKITYLESDGRVYLRYKDKQILLQPNEEYETSFREDNRIHMLHIKNHGLLDKERIIVE